jgi:flagellar biosynthetic protein FlhB
MAEQDHDRSQPASSFKLKEARKQGQVAKSLDVNSAVLLWTLLLALLWVGSGIWNRLAQLAAALFMAAASAGDGPSRLLELISAMVTGLAQVLAPLFVLAVIAGVAANLLQTGPILSFSSLKPKWERLNPVSGFKRVFNSRMLFDALKSCLKFLLLGWIAVAYLRARGSDIAGFWSADGVHQMRWMGSIALGLAMRLAAALLVIALLDLLHARWRFGRQMRMSRREVKEETKRREGDPQIRAKLRQLQRENVKQAASMARVPSADILVTNPDHVAIALRYVAGQMAAPQVIAKGCDIWAMKMKDLARAKGIPMYERRSLARLLLKRAALDAPIPSECYVDVARLYADVEAMRRRLVRYEVRT